MHAVGVLHRDVKPSNVLMEGRTPILIDFGLARVADDPKLTHTGWLLGTPGYLAARDPLRRRRDHRLRRALVGRHGRVRRHRPPAVRPRARRWRSWTGSGAASTTSTGLPDALRQRGRRRARPRPRAAAEPRRDPAAGCDPDTTQPRRTPCRRPPDDRGPFTMPLAIAAQAGRARTPPTESGATAGDPPPGPAVSRRRRRDRLPAPGGLLGRRLARRAAPAAPAGSDPGAGRRRAPSGPVRRACCSSPARWPPAPPSRAVPLAAVAVLAAASVWLLRSGSLAASAAGDRQQAARRAKWYDGVVAPLSAPRGTCVAVDRRHLLLALWAVGFAVAAGLLCYAFAAGPTIDAVRQRVGAGRRARVARPGRLAGPLGRWPAWSNPSRRAGRRRLGASRWPRCSPGRVGSRRRLAEAGVAPRAARAGPPDPARASSIRDPATSPGAVAAWTACSSRSIIIT